MFHHQTKKILSKLVDNCTPLRYNNKQECEYNIETDVPRKERR